MYLRIIAKLATYMKTSINSGEHRSFGVPADKSEKRSASVDVLDAYAVERWEV